MYYIIYKTTNLINGKFYIGKHQTKKLNDGYIGSGKLLRRALNKYGKENFHTEIIEIYDEEWKMNIAEKILVVIDLEISYNLCKGGKGGFGYLNSTRKNIYLNHSEIARINIKKWNVRASQEYISNTVFKKSLLLRTEKAVLQSKINNPNGTFFGKKHSEETKKKIAEKNSLNTGIKNSQYGTCWITNGIENKKIKKDELDDWIQLGYYRGRKIF